MKESQILEPCAASSLKCWSIAYRSFEGRREQILIAATRVFGNRTAAERWLHSRVLGLGRQTPCSLLSTRSDYEHVNTFLSQIEYGVYV
ncbi:MbcA/ParS/Xre antitoxin family protein [Pseudomonas putida]|uniref:Transposition protein, TnsD-related protein n=1 Tax=Pseudomonas putida TaxID=303 RepID=A0A1L7NNG5_PSEPU|nr:MbcA/ParS/Xre antitoxin family protein [Pseudomonas putida]BAW27009.1 Transposition protein, TnsD-related protein [Pseudomonas putida]